MKELPIVIPLMAVWVLVFLVYLLVVTGELDINGTVKLEIGEKSEMEREVQISAESVQEYFAQAEIAFGEKRYLDAASLYQKSIDALPTVSALLNLGVSLYSSERYEDAEKAYLNALQFAEKRGQTNFISAIQQNLGNLYANMERKEDACKAYEKAIDFEKIDKKNRAFVEEQLKLLCEWKNPQPSTHGRFYFLSKGRFMPNHCFKDVFLVF